VVFDKWDAESGVEEERCDLFGVLWVLIRSIATAEENKKGFVSLWRILLDVGERVTYSEREVLHLFRRERHRGDGVRACCTGLYVVVVVLSWEEPGW